MKSRIIRKITSHYFESGDFNGLPFSSLLAEFGLDTIQGQKHLKKLLSEGEIEVVSTEFHLNPHIKAFSGVSKDAQRKYIEDADLLYDCCIYPSQEYLQQVCPSDKYINAPYTKELALGAGQLDYKCFDVSVLEYYRNDPRYHYDNNDISGWICVRDQYLESDTMANTDKTLIESFGFCYSEDFDRGVAVFLRYLNGLTTQHQQLWKSKELNENYKLHPDYYRNSILGEFGTKISIFDAFIYELDMINKMCWLMGKPELFKETFIKTRPREFGFILRPTLNEFNTFAHLLDKMMSDNFSKKFFEEDLALEYDEKRKDGKFVVREKGTISLLEEWFNTFFTPSDPKIINDMLSIFKKIRKIRQRPAHSINENEFNQQYFKDQRQLIKDAYVALRTLRLAFANHPRVMAKPPIINGALFRGDIWDI